MLAELLLTLFIGLKLTGIIDWSWFWVVSPLWVGAVISFAVGFIDAKIEQSNEKADEEDDKIDLMWNGRNK